MKKKTFIYFIIIITIINLSSLGAILYQQKKMSCPSYQSNEQTVINLVKQEVNLTSSQIKQFKKLKITFHKKIDSLSVKVQNYNKLLAIEIKKDNPDTVIINNLINNLSKIQNKSKYIVIQHFFSIKKILSKDQQEKFFNIVLKRFLGRNRLMTPSGIQQKEINNNCFQNFK